MDSKGVFATGKRALAPLSLAVLLGTGIAGIGRLSPALAAGQAAGLDIYRGDNPQASGIKLSSWGSGTATAEAKVSYSGSGSVKIVSHGLYQGARLVFNKPVDLTPYLTNKTAYLQFILLLPNANNSAMSNFPGGGGFPGGGAFPGGGQGGPPPGFLNQFTNGGRGGGGGNGARGGEAVKAQKAKPVENIRALLLTDGGKTIEAMLPLSYAKDENGWKILSIPVPALTELKSDDATIKEIRLFADSPVTMYLGEVRVSIDATPLRVERLEEKVFPRNTRERFIGSASGGSSPLKYTWDFDSSDGDDQEDAEGRSVYHTYTKAGDYVATLMVSDPYGMKTPTKTKFKIHVTP